MPTIYEKLLAAGCEIANHSSDLYTPATPEAVALVRAETIRASDGADPVPLSFSRFVGNDGRTWLDIPFSYAPFWARRRD